MCANAMKCVVAMFLLLLGGCAPPVEEWVEVDGQKCLRYQEYMGDEIQVLCPRETP